MKKTFILCVHYTHPIYYCSIEDCRISTFRLLIGNSRWYLIVYYASLLRILVPRCLSTCLILDVFYDVYFKVWLYICGVLSPWHWKSIRNIFVWCLPYLLETTVLRQILDWLICLYVILVDTVLWIYLVPLGTDSVLQTVDVSLVTLFHRSRCLLG